VNASGLVSFAFLFGIFFHFNPTKAQMRDAGAFRDNNQGVNPTMFNKLRAWIPLAVIGALLLLAPGAAFAQSQTNAADLRGTVTDEAGKVIGGAKVTIRNEKTSISRETTTNAEGVYQFLALPPDPYELTIEAQGFSKSINKNIVLTIGSASDLDITMRVGSLDSEVVDVNADTQVIESSKTAVSETINQRSITNLPSNGRGYVNFTLLTSQTTRDNQPSLGTAPTSGLNFGGQRARANNVSIDGADASDSATNGVRATVSQEAVQEFQILTNSYAAEFGRASAAVINIVSKGGGNDIHGNVFAFLRDQSVSARNAFAGVNDYPATRFQGGFTVGGPIQKERFFYFLAFEATTRNETGFSQIGRQGFGLVNYTPPAALAAAAGPQAAMLTPAQVTFINNTLTAISALPPANQAQLLPVLANYYVLAREGAAVGLGGNLTSNFGVLPNTRFFPLLGTTFTPNPLPGSFTTLNSLIGNYSTSEKTFFPSLRLDYRFNESNNFFLRASVTPSTVTGIPSNGQNQPTGLNNFSRTGFNGSRDFALVAQNVSTLQTGTLINEARFQASRRSIDYGPQGGRVGVEVPGFASFGREPFSPTKRTEKRFQVTDNITKIVGNHTVKFGADYNLVLTNALFEVNFGGIYSFPELAPSTLGFPTTFPGVGGTIPRFSQVQAYGLGIPESYVQNTGTPTSNFNNPELGLFVQDSWKIRPNFTLNYGVRYDVEWTKQIGAVQPTLFPNLYSTGERILGIQQGIPRDYNNFAPRIAFSWDPFNDGKTAIRAAYGLFYGRPLLGLAFLSDVVDGAQSPFLVFPGVLGGASIFRGANASPSSPFPVGVNSFCGADVNCAAFIAAQQRLPFNSVVNGGFTGTFPDAAAARFSDPITTLALSPVTSQTLHVNRNFKYDNTQQASLTVERQFLSNFSLGVTYSYIKGKNLVRPRNVNQQNLTLLQNLARAQAGDTTSPLFGLPQAFGAAGALTRFFFNDFRRTGPNLIYTTSVLNNGNVTPTTIAATQTILNNLTTAFNLPRLQGEPFVPFGSVKNYESTGNSNYHSLTVNVNKRFSQNYQFLASYTWSHAIDDSTDVQTLQEPQDNSNPRGDRSNSNFDQRHRFVFSGVVTSPFKRDGGFGRYLLADWTFAPIVEFASGRPYTVLTGNDQTQVNSSSTSRPNLVAACPAGTTLGNGCFTAPNGTGFFVLPPDSRTVFGLPLSSYLGNLGRNAYRTPYYASVDFRLARKFFFTKGADMSAQNLEFIFEAFNVFNRTNISEVLTSFQAAGRPVAASPARQLQFALKFSF
jgi:hypothetical protein